MRHSKQGFTSMIDIILSFVHFISIRKFFKSNHSFLRINTSNHWTFFNIRIIETIDIFNKDSNIIFKFNQKGWLFFLKLGLFDFSERNQIYPVSIKTISSVKFFFISHSRWDISFKNLILFLHWTEFHFNNSCFFLNLLKSIHNSSKRINIIFNFHWDSLFELFSLFGKALK